MNRHSAAVVIVAAALGAVAGAIAGLMLPPDKFAWTGFALLPLFVLLEASLSRFGALVAGDRNSARVILAGTVVAGFYVAWIACRPS